MGKSDGQLVMRTLEGDSTAFDDLIERHRSRMIHIVMGKVGIREEALDIAQEAFIHAYMSLHTLNNPEQFAPWLIAIAENLCKMKWRRMQRVTVPLDQIEIADKSLANDNSILDTLKVLPSGTREAADLFFVEGLKQSEIAARLGISLPAVKARIREARASLRKEMVDMAKQTPKETYSDFTANLKQKLELARWYRTIADHCGSGGDVMTGLQAICKSDFSLAIIDATKKIIDAVNAGRTVTDALAEIPILASPETTAMMKAGEQFGSLTVAGRILADWLEVQDAQRRIELIFWCRTLGFLLAADVPITDTLNYGVDIAHSKALQQATREIIQVLKNLGDNQPTDSPLRPVLDKYPDVFPPILKLAVLVGENIGKLDQTLCWAADIMSDDLALNIASGLLGEKRELTPRRPLNLITEGLLHAQCITLLSDHAPDIRAAAIDALGRLNWTDAASEIAIYLDDDSADVRIAAARVIAELGYKDAEQALVRRLKDPDPVVRRTAIQSIIKLELHNAARFLADVIMDTDHRVISAAIDSLVDLQETEVMKQKAIEMFHSEVWEEQKRAAYLLRYFIPQEAVEKLVNALPNELSVQQINAVIVLGLYGCTQVRPILNQLVLNHDYSTRVARAMREIGDSTTAAAIREAIKAGILDASYSETADAMDYQTCK